MEETLEGIDYAAREALHRDETYRQVDRECDVVMKGGITSGVLYPLAVCELAASYRLRNVGGTSAGAIAAAAAAAAEYGRQSDAPGSGFVGLAKLPDWSSEPGNLVGVFQPDAATKRLHGLLLAAVAKPADAIGKALKPLRIVFHLLAAALGRHIWAPLLGVAPGVLLLWVLRWAPRWHWLMGIGLLLSLLAIVGAIAALGLAPEPPEEIRCVPHAERERRRKKWRDDAARRRNRTVVAYAVVVTASVALVLLISAADSVRILWGAALAMLAIAIGLLVGTLVAVVLGAGRSLSANMYGIVAGSSPGNDSLSDWLTELIDELAGRAGARPLTFGDLWEGPAGSSPPEGEKFVNLEMLTTCLTQARPYRLPNSLGQDFFYDPAEFERIFPKKVMVYLNSYQAEPESTSSARKKRAALVNSAAQQGLKPLPPPRDLPVVVATRMSLSFPVLISAVPLYAIDYTCAASDGSFEFEPCWFSDGGITSNFPITFFDALLPRRPTFGINLRKFHPAHPQSAQEECQNIWMPDDNRGGITEWWTRPARTTGVGGVVGFLLSIIDTMQNWVDNQQTRVPGFRDRIIHIYHNDDEGGINLQMPPETLVRLSERGRCAGSRLVEYYTTEEPGRTVSWENHRWIRMRTMLALLEEAMQAIGTAYPGDYAMDIKKRPDELPSYEWANLRQRAIALTLMEGEPDEPGEPPLIWPRGFAAIGAMLDGEIARQSTVSMSNQAPSPQPRLEIRPGE